MLNFLHVQKSRNSEDFQTKWLLVELSEHISNMLFRMKATVPALPSYMYLFIILNSQRLT